MDIGRQKGFNMLEYINMYCKCGRKLKTPTSKKQKICGMCYKKIKDEKLKLKI